MTSQGVIRSFTQTISGFRIHVYQYQPTQRPIEDRYSISTSPEENPNRLILGVYDGHGGAATAEHVSSILPTALLERLPQAHTQIFREIDDMMVQAFVRDHSLLSSKSRDWEQHARVVKSGCTALIFDIDIASLTASVSNAGDCRAVLFSPSESQEGKLHQTQDCNAKSPAEQARLQREHPSEDSIVIGGRLFGRVMSTRGFGDAYYKLPLGPFGNWKHKRYISALSAVEDPGKVTMTEQYDTMFHFYRTPPYITSSPVVETMSLTENAFVIMASDGLWDCVSSEVAVETVHRARASRLQEDADFNIAEYLLMEVMQTGSPGDDVTILVLEAPSSQTLVKSTSLEDDNVSRR